MADFKETCIEYLDADDHATFFSSERKWISKILRFKEEYPNDVEITEYPETNHGFIVAHVPKSWFKVGPPRKSNFTDEQRAEIAERLALSRKKL